MDLLRSSESHRTPADVPGMGAIVTTPDGHRRPLDEERLRTLLAQTAEGILHQIDSTLIIQELYRTIFEGISEEELYKALILATTSFIERDPGYSLVASRLLQRKLRAEVTGRESVLDPSSDALYRRSLGESIDQGISLGQLDPRMTAFDIPALAALLVPERDNLIDYMGMHTLYERYLLKHKQHRYELPQTFWMRVAMGLALEEENKMKWAETFYTTISTLRYVPGTPTLFHAGFKRAQLSSCYLNTVEDDLGHIFKLLGDNAQLAKWAGGLGTDWTNIRGAGSLISSIKATSQGVVPYLKIANDMVGAITRTGIRRGGSCVYLEAWHIDIEDFLDLRRTTGDERRRTHDLNTAIWVPDLFMKRVLSGGMWTLFSPQETPDLHHLYGKAFEERYEQYEALMPTGAFALSKQLPADQLWRKMLTRLFETGHPWITFKDPCNIRSPQDHMGTVHCSNLCTEITLNTSPEETAVCNLGSVNLKTHIREGVLDCALLQETVSAGMRMLDNVIDLNFYPIKEARTANTRHRPVGLGIMGFQDALFLMDIPFSNPRAAEVADQSMEHIAYFAISASADLAQEKGAYSSFRGSKWDRGIFPLDTLDLLEAERGRKVHVSRTSTLDWSALKEKVARFGMRNSNCMAIAPTATISTIAGCYPCIEPIFKNLYVKSNVSGDFTVINTYLINDLKRLNLWNQTMIDQIKYYDGELSQIQTIPAALKEKYKTAFELDPEWLIQVTAVRGKWIDQSQSHNVFIKGVSGKKMHAIYLAAWEWGFKTTYYARTLGATQIEKSTLDAKTFGFTQNRVYTLREEVKAGEPGADGPPDLSADLPPGSFTTNAPEMGLPEGEVFSTEFLSVRSRGTQVPSPGPSGSLDSNGLVPQGANGGQMSDLTPSPFGRSSVRAPTVAACSLIEEECDSCQ